MGNGRVGSGKWEVGSGEWEVERKNSPLSTLHSPLPTLIRLKKSVGGSSFADSESDWLGTFGAAAFVGGPVFIDVDTLINSTALKPDTDVFFPVYWRKRTLFLRVYLLAGRIIRLARQIKGH